MDEMKRFAFLVDAGDMIIVNRVWHDTEEAAKKHLQKVLLPCYSIVEDQQVIEAYVTKEMAEMEAEGWDTHRLTIEHYEDLQTIKKSLEKEQSKMNIDEQMAYIRKALENGASVNVSFHNIDEEGEALKIAHSFSKLVDVPFEEVNSGIFSWFKIEGPIQTTVFFNKGEYMEEDVQLDGMESGDRIA